MLKLYRAESTTVIKLPSANPLQDAHAALNTAVLTAYGFSAKKDLLAQLLALNQEVAAKIELGEPVMPPGGLEHYPDGRERVMEDGIKPADKSRHDKLVVLVDKLLGLMPKLRAATADAEKAVLQNAVTATDQQIDALVYDLYGLTPEEIQLVEGAQ